MSEKVKQCLAIENDDQALSCVREEIRRDTGSCRDRLVLLVKEGCTGCAEEKARFKKEIETGEVTVIDITTDEGRMIAEKNELYYVPAVLVLDCQGKALE